MKQKWLVSLLTGIMMFALCMAVACNVGSGNNGTGRNDAAIAQDAIDSVRMMYTNASTETPVDYKVIGKTKVGDTLYDVTWSVSSATPDIENYVVVGTELDASMQYTIGITKSDEPITYTLTATVKVGSASESVDFTRTIPAGIHRDDETVVKRLEFTDMINRTSFDATKQVWEQNGIKLTNTVGSSPVADYGNPARFYKNSTVIIEFPCIIHVDFSTRHFDNSPYHTNLQQSLEAAFPDATVEYTLDASGNDLVTLELAQAVNVLEFTCSVGQVQLYYIDVEGIVGGASDEQIVKAAKNALTLTQTTFNSLGSVELPAEKNGATVSWSITSDYATVEGNTLTINSLPEEGEQKATLTATLTVNEATETKDFELTFKPSLGLTNDGSEQHPFTVAEALKIGNDLDQNAYYTVDGVNTAVYVTGYIVATGEWNSTYSNWTKVYIADSASDSSSNGIQVYRLEPGTLLTPETGLKLGAKITVYGYIQKFYSTFETIEITYNGSTNPQAVEYDDTGIVTPEPPEPSDKVFTPITTPVEGTEYYMGMKCSGDVWYYLTGSPSGYYLGTTTDIASAAKVELIADGEGWLLKCGSNYIEIELSGKHINAVYKATRTADMNWSWDSDYNIFVWTVEGKKCFLGTYGSYNTVGGGDYTLHVADNYLAVLGTWGDAEDVPPVHNHTYKYTDETDTQHRKTCETCDDVNELENHRYDNDQDTTCNDCGHTREVTPVDPVDPVEAVDIVADFLSKFDTYAATWGASYTSHSVTFADLGVVGLEGTVAFSAASKQEGTITDRPVAAGKSSATFYVTITLTKGNITSFEFNLKRWSDAKTFTDIHLEYNDGSAWTSCSEALSGALSDDTVLLGSNVELKGVTSVRLVITASSGDQNQQIGITSVKMGVTGTEVDVEASDFAKVEAALATVEETMTVGAIGDTVLPLHDVVTFEYEVNGDLPDYATFEGHTLSISKLPSVAGQITVTLTARIGTSYKTKVITIDIKASALLPESVTYDFSFNASANTTAMNSSTLKTYFESAGAGDELSSVTAGSYVYKGDSSKGVGTLKVGKSRGNGSFTLQFSGKVTKVIVTFMSYSSSKGKLTVNGQGSNSFHTSQSADTIELTEASGTLEFASTERVYISSIQIFFEQ